jgi:tetratricopeptide (TPR) repeat protein
MKQLRSVFFVLAVVSWGLSPAWAVRPEVKQLQDQWAEIKYHQPADRQEALFGELAAHSEKALQALPNDAEALIWHGIIEGSYAGAKGGLKALGIVKNAKLKLERAIELDPSALDGSAYTSLGSLYYQVPGWPIGFGDDEKAEQFLKMGLSVNPQGIDPNYFYGDFLFRKGQLLQSKEYLHRALAAHDRPGRALADEGRRREIQNLLAEIAQKTQ